MQHLPISVIFVVLVLSISLSESVPAVLNDYTIDVSVADTTVTPKAQPRVPKTARTTTTTTTTTTTAAPTAAKKIATHPPWPEKASTSRPKATHAPWPGEPGYKRATHAPYPYKNGGQYDHYSFLEQSEHLYPQRSTYAPYIYGSSNMSQKSKRKSIFEKEVLNSWAKDLMAYVFAPFLMPQAMSQALTMPAGLEPEGFWGKVARTFRSAFLRRSEERNNQEMVMNDGPDNLLLKIIKNGNKMVRTKILPATSSVVDTIAKKIKEFAEDDEEDKDDDKISTSEKKKKSVTGSGSHGYQDKISRFVDFFRIRKPRLNSSQSSSSSVNSEKKD